jgi:putative copper export protein
VSDVPFGDAVARWLQLAATLVIVGSIVAPLLDPGITAERSRRLRRVAALLAFVALLGRLLVASAALLDPGMPLRPLHVVAMLGTAWGRGWMAQAATVLAVLLLTLDGGSGTAAWRERLAALAAALAVPLTGHAMTFPAGSVAGVAATALHVLGAGAWLGTLAALLLLRTASLPATLQRFAPVALTSAGVLGASGIAVTWGALGGLPLPARLLASDYGRTLATKLLLVAAILAAGAAPERSFLRTAWLEVGLAIAVLAVTAVVGLLDPPGHG